MSVAKKEFKESDVEFHHLLPKYMGGKDIDGRKYLCKKCHSIIHNILPKLIYKFVPLEKKQVCKDYIKNVSLYIIKKGIK